MITKKAGFAVFSWGDRCSNCGSYNTQVGGPKGEDGECRDCGWMWTN